jgi:hypothetical protein
MWMKKEAVVLVLLFGLLFTTGAAATQAQKARVVKRVAIISAVGFTHPVYVDPAKVSYVYWDEGSAKWTIRLASQETIPTTMGREGLFWQLGWTAERNEKSEHAREGELPQAEADAPR